MSILDWCFWLRWVKDVDDRGQHLRLRKGGTGWVLWDPKYEYWVHGSWIPLITPQWIDSLGECGDWFEARFGWMLLLDRYFYEDILALASPILLYECEMFSWSDAPRQLAIGRDSGDWSQSFDGCGWVQESDFSRKVRRLFAEASHGSFNRCCFLTIATSYLELRIKTRFDRDVFRPKWGDIQSEKATKENKAKMK